MSTRSIQVQAWGEPVGVIAPSKTSGAYAFEYYPAWLKRGVDLAPVTMPVSAGSRVWAFPGLHESFQRLPGLVGDALPDDFGNALVDAWMASQGVRKDEITMLDRLAYMGRRSMGALEFHPVGGPNDEAEAAIPIAIKNLVEEARSLVEGKFEAGSTTTALQNLIRVGTSAGGARAKAVIAWNLSSNEIRSGQFDVGPGFEHWLLKFDGLGEDAALGSSADYGRIEYAYYLMASNAGIRMEQCRLLEEGGRAHFMTKRFDRDGNVKHHLQTLCSMAHMSYRLIGTHAYEQGLMVAKESLGVDDGQMQEAFRRMAFNVAARNNDDHTKNVSYILPNGGRWALAPAYDVTYAYNPKGPWTHQHLMSVNGKFSDITSEDLLTVAERFMIPEASAILKQVDESVRAWPEFAAQAGLGRERTDRITRNHVQVAPVHRPRVAAAEEVQPLPDHSANARGRKPRPR